MNAVNHCPECGGSQWHVGRISAECAVCDIPLPLAKYRVLDCQIDNADTLPRSDFPGRTRALAAMLVTDVTNF